MHIKLKGKHAKYAGLLVRSSGLRSSSPHQTCPLIYIFKQTNYKAKSKVCSVIIRLSGDREVLRFIYMLRNQFDGADKRPNNKQSGRKPKLWLGKGSGGSGGTIRRQSQLAGSFKAESKTKQTGARPDKRNRDRSQRIRLKDGQRKGQKPELRLSPVPRSTH